MTPRRWAIHTRAFAYRYLVLRDGEQCSICHAVPTTRNNRPHQGSTTQNDSNLATTPIVSPTTQNIKAPTTQNPFNSATIPLVSSTTQNTLDIDHIDGNPKNNEPDNLRLLCRRCNVSLSNKSRPRRSLSSDLSVCVREIREGKPATRIAREDANYREGSPEMQANLLYEVPFRRWIMKQVTTNGSYDYSTAMNEGAEVTGCSPQTTSRYLAKLTSPAGPLTETKDALGHRVLILKPHLQSPPEPLSPP
jgi:hypothetical protein